MSKWMKNLWKKTKKEEKVKWPDEPKNKKQLEKKKEKKVKCPND